MSITLLIEHVYARATKEGLTRASGIQSISIVILLLDARILKRIRDFLDRFFIDPISFSTRTDIFEGILLIYGDVCGTF